MPDGEVDPLKIWLHQAGTGDTVDQRARKQGRENTHQNT